MALNNVRYNKSLASTCVGCGVGCGLTISQHRNRNVLFEGDHKHPVNEGVLCTKGLDVNYSHFQSPERLLFPQVRYNRNMPLKKAGWEQTMQRVVAVMKALMKQYGTSSIAFHLSQNAFIEESYIIQKLLKEAIGSNQLFFESFAHQGASYEKISQTFKGDLQFATYEDLEKADCLLFTADPGCTHPVLWERIVALKARKPELFIIAVGAGEGAVTAIADHHLDVFPGTEPILFQAIAKGIIEDGNLDKAFITHALEGYPAFKDTVFSRSIVEAAKICGTSVEDISTASRLLGHSAGFVSVWSEGEIVSQSSSVQDLLITTISLHLLTGQIGKPGTGPMLLTKSANARGNWEVEKLFDTVAISGRETRKEQQAKPIKNVNSTAQERSTHNLFEGLKAGTIKAVWFIGGDFVKDFPDTELLEEGLGSAKFVVCQGSAGQANLLNFADALLPATHRSEKAGTIMNCGGGLSFIPQINNVPPEVLSDISIACMFARGMGFSGFQFDRVEDIFLEYASRATGNKLAGVDYQLLRKNKVFQPVNKENHHGSSALKNDVGLKKVKMTIPLPHQVAGGNPNDFPYLLEYHIVKREKASCLPDDREKGKEMNHKTYLALHPLDAEKHQIGSEDLVEITSTFGQVRTRAVLSENIKMGSAFLYLNLWSISREDQACWKEFLNGFFLSPTMPSLKRVSINRYEKPVQKIVIIGAGAAAFGFVKTYRQINQNDEIEIFSKERTPFYDRYMLPEYLSGAQVWDQLLKLNAEEEAALNLTLHRGLSILKINRKGKYLIDTKNNKTRYDILIIATGSRAAIPKNTPKKAGIFTMRSRNDAENFRSKVPANAEVVIVGGGFLGLEVAASLREKGTKVTIVQRTSRFLDRQLDPLGSQLLHEEMTELGCEIYYNEEVQLYYGQSQLTGVGLKSGRKIKCQAMVIVIGNIPNIHLAKDCGLSLKRGIVVNEHLQSSDPNIFAIGEIAEVHGTLYSFPVAAEDQARIAAQFINGDTNSAYSGSLMKNAIRLQGFDLCSIGLPECPDDKAYEEVVLIDKKQRYYKKCVIYQDKLVGTILIGDKAEFEEFGKLIAEETPLKGKRAQLLKRNYREIVPEKPKAEVSLDSRDAFCSADRSSGAYLKIGGISSKKATETEY